MLIPINNPRPKIIADQPPTLVLPVKRRIKCPTITPPPTASFENIFENRRSVRRLRSASIREISNAISYATRPRFIKEGDRFNRSKRPSSSAGALHPISVAVVTRGRCPRVFHYDAMEHQLSRLNSVFLEPIQELIQTCSTILPEGQGTILVFVAEVQRTGSVYENPDSLIWRDAGALMQTLAFTFCAYGLAFCPLGILGNEVPSALNLSASLLGVGVAVVGHPIIDS